VGGGLFFCPVRLLCRAGDVCWYVCVVVSYLGGGLVDLIWCIFSGGGGAGHYFFIFLCVFFPV